MDNIYKKTISLLITYQCNLNCSYCYERHKTNKSMGVEDAKKYIQQEVEIFRKETQYKFLEISFMGGEPLLEFGKIRQIAEWCWEQNWDFDYILFATTNGTLLNEEMKAWLIENKKRFVLGLSFDGNESMQNMNRSNSASMIDIDFFYNTWPDQAPKMTLSPDSMPELADGILALHKVGYGRILANLAYGVEWSEKDMEEYSRQLFKLIDYYLDNPEQERCSLLDIDMINALCYTAKQSKVCGCGVGSITIDTDGKRYPCQMFAPITIESNESREILKKNFGDVTNFIVEHCRSCVLNKICPKCYGMNFLLYKDMRKQPIYICRSFKIQFLANCILTQKQIEKKQIKENVEEYERVLRIVNDLLVIK